MSLISKTYSSSKSAKLKIINFSFILIKLCLTLSILTVETTSVQNICKDTLQHLGEIDAYNEHVVEPEPEIKRGTARLRRNAANFSSREIIKVFRIRSYFFHSFELQVFFTNKRYKRSLHHNIYEIQLPSLKYLMKITQQPTFSRTIFLYQTEFQDSFSFCVFLV